MEVRNESGGPVAGANVTAEIALRYAVNGVTDAEGAVTLAFDPEQLKLHQWSKITAETADYPPVSVLAELKEGGPPTVITLGQPAPTPPPAAAAPTAEAEAAAAAPDTDERPLAAVSPAERADYYSARPPMTIDPTKNHRATIRTSKGDIVVSLNAQAAPEHVNNFIFLANQGFYDGLTFHRGEPGFVIQGGRAIPSAPAGWAGLHHPGEFALTHGLGALAMARQGDAVNRSGESSGSQFYITLAPTPPSMGNTAFLGRCGTGAGVVQAIQIGDTIEQVIIE